MRMSDVTLAVVDKQASAIVPRSARMSRQGSKLLIAIGAAVLYVPDDESADDLQRDESWRH